jgi:purine nucleoside permease
MFTRSLVAASPGRAVKWCCVVLLAGASHAADAGIDPANPPAPPVAVKVMIVNMFAGEAAPWLAALHPQIDIPVPGLAADSPAVLCTPAGVCQMTTGMGHANAAASMMAVLYSRLFDLRQTYFVIAGIAGIDPERGTLGSAAWARYVVDAGIAHEIDARELPRGWTDEYFGVFTDSPDQVPKFEYKTEVYRLDEALLQRALNLSQAVTLEDDDAMQAYRRHYREPAARRPPAVIQCDTLTSDTWWVGRRLGEHARRWTRLLTGGKGIYCTSQEEDNATLAALDRGSRSALIDLRRVAVVRTGSDFDRPYPGQSALASLHAARTMDSAFKAAAQNLVRAAMPLVEDISTHWERWQDGVAP